MLFGNWKAALGRVAKIRLFFLQNINVDIHKPLQQIIIQAILINY